MSTAATGMGNREAGKHASWFLLLAIGISLLVIYPLTKMKKHKARMALAGPTWYISFHELDGSPVNDKEESYPASYQETPTRVHLTFKDKWTGVNEMRGLKEVTGYETPDGPEDGWLCSWKTIGGNSKPDGGAFITQDGPDIRYVYIWLSEKQGGGGIQRKFKLTRQ